MTSVYTYYPLTCFATVENATGLYLNSETTLFEAYDDDNAELYLVPFGADLVAMLGRQKATFTIHTSLLPCTVTVNVFDNETTGAVGSDGFLLDAAGVVLDKAIPLPVKLAADGLDAISFDAQAGRPTTFRGALMWLFRRFANKHRKTNDSLFEVLDDTNTNALTAAPLEGTGSNQTVGMAVTPT